MGEIKQINVSGTTYDIAGKLYQSTTTTTSNAYPLLASAQVGRTSWTNGFYDSFVNSEVTLNPGNGKMSIGAGTVGTGVADGSGYNLYENTNSKFYGSLHYGRKWASGTTPGLAILALGNNYAASTAGSASGELDIYNTTAYCNSIVSKAASSNKTTYIPNVTGELVVHTNNTAVGGPTNPVYVSSDGQITAAATYTSGNYTSFVPYASSSGIMEIGRCIDFHSQESTNDYDYRLLVNETTANHRLRLYTTSPFNSDYANSYGFSIEVPLIMKSGTTTTGNYTTTVPTSAGQTGQMMFVLQ